MGAIEGGADAARRGTYSIVARDAGSGELGVAVQSHWFSVGSLVSWAAPGVGAVATPTPRTCAARRSPARPTWQRRGCRRRWPSWRVLLGRLEPGLAPTAVAVRDALERV